MDGGRYIDGSISDSCLSGKEAHVGEGSEDTGETSERLSVG